MYVEDDPAHTSGTRQEPKNEAESNQEQARSWHQKEPVRRVEQHETKAAPTIVKRPQMGTASSPFIRPERDWNFCKLYAKFIGLDYEFQRELHTCGARINALVNAFRESAHATVGIPYTGVEKIVQDSCNGGITESLVQPRHGAGLDTSFKSVSHHQLVTLAPASDKVGHFGKVVAVIGIAHDDKFALGFLNPLSQGIAVTLNGGVHHTGTV